MTLRDVMRIALTELGMPEEEIAARIAEANMTISPLGEDVSNVVPGRERQTIAALKTIILASKDPEMQRAMHDHLAELRQKIASIAAKN